MQIDFHEKYGHCEIPKGLILYRGSKTDVIYDEMFFGTKYYSVTTFGGERVQIWKTKKTFNLLFLIRKIDYYGRADSSIPDLYYDIFPNESNKNLDDLDVKQYRKRRQPFVERLFNNHNIVGWFTSIENNSEVELCLFNKEMVEELVELIEIVHCGDGYKYDSMREIKLFPNNSFFQKSKLAIRNIGLGTKKDPYKEYRKYYRNCVKDYTERGGDMEDGKQLYYNLRTKLKI